jgi:hypothetical protein
MTYKARAKACADEVAPESKLLIDKLKTEMTIQEITKQIAMISMVRLTTCQNHRFRH